MLGVPTVADRIAQTVVALLLEPSMESIFHDDSYGYRPGQVTAGCGREMPRAVLEEGLDSRPGCPRSSSTPLTMI